MLIILTTHPIQYQVPIWQQLARRADVPFQVWYLSDQGARHGLDAGFGRAFAWDLDLLSGYPHRFLPTHPPRADLSAFRGARVRSLKSLLRETEARVLWINGWQVQAYWQAAFRAHTLGVPVWLRGETNDLRRSSPAREVPRSLALHLLFRRVSRFLYIGAANRRMYRQFGVPEERLVAAPYCVDNARFEASAEALRPARSELRAQWGIPPAATCLLFAGKLVPKKRPIDVVNALCLALARRPHLAERLHLLVAGDGELMPQLQMRAHELASRWGRQLLTFVGFLNQTEIPGAYAAADCLVLPSDSGETWGLVVNEALASGVPAIVSNLCGCAEDLVEPLDRRFVFPCGQVEALSTLIEGIALGAIPLPDGSRCRAAVAGHDVGATVDAVLGEYRAAAGA